MLKNVHCVYKKCECEIREPAPTQYTPPQHKTKSRPSLLPTKSDDLDLQLERLRSLFFRLFLHDEEASA